MVLLLLLLPCAALDNTPSAPGIVASIAAPAGPEDAEVVSVSTADGLGLRWRGSQLSGASVGGHALSGGAGAGDGGGFQVRSYTSPSPPEAELLLNPRFTQAGGGGGARGWAGVGGGYSREPIGGAGQGAQAVLTLHNARTNTTSGATQLVDLPTSLWQRPAGAGATVLRLSGWASAHGLRSAGTCADQGSCRLHDAFGLNATLTYYYSGRHDGQQPGHGHGHSVSLPAASFQSGSHDPEYAFAVLRLPPAPPAPPPPWALQGTVQRAVLRVTLLLRGYAGNVSFANVSLVPLPWSDFSVAAQATRLNQTALRITGGTAAPTLPPREGPPPPPAAAPAGAGVPPLRIDAVVAAHARHVRIDGTLQLLPAAARGGGAEQRRSAAGQDHALTLRFGVPIGLAAAAGAAGGGGGGHCVVGLDPRTAVSVPAAGGELAAGGGGGGGGGGVIHARRQRGYYDGAGQEGTTEGEIMVPPLPSDWYPLLSLTTSAPEAAQQPRRHHSSGGAQASPSAHARGEGGETELGVDDDGAGADAGAGAGPAAAAAAGLAIALPMEPTAYVSRAEFAYGPASPSPSAAAAAAASAAAAEQQGDSQSQAAAAEGLLSLEFDLALTPRASGRYNRSTSFSLLLYHLRHMSMIRIGTLDWLRFTYTFCDTDTDTADSELWID
jgi:hypothetical protein